MRFLSELQHREIEYHASLENINLIDKAASEIYKYIKSNFSIKNKILILVGPGNNGSDGLATAIKLYKNKFDVDVYLVSSKPSTTNSTYLTEYSKYKKPLDSLLYICDYDLIVDAMLGIGLSKPLDDNILDIVGLINKSSKYLLSIDVPTGLCAFTGKVFNDAIHANTTITFLSDKPGLYTGDGVDYVGKTIVKKLMSTKRYSLSRSEYSIQSNNIKDIDLSIVLRTKKNTNKGTYGHLGIVGGNVGMNGALQLAGNSSLYSGCGKVSLIPIDSGFDQDISMPEIMVKNIDDILNNYNIYSALAIGVGFGMSDKSVSILSDVIDTINIPMVFDADALNIIAQNEYLRSAFIKLQDKIITPHPAEAARLLDCTTNEIQNDRFSAVIKLSQKYNATVVLKGAGTLICKDDSVYINQTGNQGMAVAGQGDVLTGIIGSFLAQGLDSLSACRLASYVHGKASDNLVRKLGGYVAILPSRVAKEVSKVLNKL